MAAGRRLAAWLSGQVDTSPAEKEARDGSRRHRRCPRRNEQQCQQIAAKIEATIDNAKVMRSASPTLIALTDAYTTNRTPAPRSAAEVPTTTPEADALSKQLKAQGYRFIGPTSVYAFMQNVGVVNDHIHGCFRASDYQPPG